MQNMTRLHKENGMEKQETVFVQNKEMEETGMDYRTFLETARRCLKEQLGEGYEVEVVRLPKRNIGEQEMIVSARMCGDDRMVGRPVPAKGIYGKYCR